MKTPLTTLTLVLGMASTALAQDITDLPDDQLLGAVVTATEARDKDRLLDLMLEVQTRKLLMFKADDAVCEFTYPDTEFFRNEIFSGAVRWAFGTDLREAAMANGYCGCILDLGTLDAFSEARAGKPADELTSADFNAFRRYRNDEWTEIDQAYATFRTESCSQ